MRMYVTYKCYLVMKKRLILLSFLLATQLVQAQSLRFKNGQLDNGLVYPIVDVMGNPEAQKELNSAIQGIIAEYKEQDYCIGQFGYVQKANFLQLNFYFNCIDLDESKTENHFFDLSTGEACTISALFLEKQKKHYDSFFADHIVKHIIENGNDAPSDDFIDSISIEDCQVELVEEGMKINLKSYESWPNEALMISWEELRPFLKSTFL